MKSALALFATLGLAAQVPTFRVSGTVVDSETTSPLNRTRVILSDESRQWSVVTTADGRFFFDVSRGRYRLEAVYRDWGNVYGEPVPLSDSGVSVVTGADCDTSQLLFRFRRQVAIRGKIVDENGEPIPGATVELFQETVSGGRKHLKALARAESSDFGEYSYSWLPAGTYYLAATGEPWYLSEMNEAQRSEFAPYEVVFFPGSPDPAGAVPVVLLPGAEVQADFALRPAAGANLLPRVIGESVPTERVFTLRSVGPGTARTIVRRCEGNCSRSFAAIRPGRYVLQFSSAASAAELLLDVKAGDIPVEIVPKPAPSLAGKVMFGTPAERFLSPLYVNIEEEHAGHLATVPVSSDGTFSWPASTIARVRLHLSGADGFFAERISVEGAAVTNGVIDLSAGSSAQATILASTATGALNGSVTGHEATASTALVVLAPIVRGDDPYRYFATQAATDGAFAFTHVPTGEYVLFAINDPGFEYANADAVHPYLADGKRVHIEARGVSTENIPLAVKEGN